MRLILAVSLFTVCGVLIAAEHTTDTPADVKKAVADKKAVLIDVREESEWNEGHLKAAMLLPLSKLKTITAAELPKEIVKEQPVYLHCGSGKRCLKAADALKNLGYDVRPLKEGFEDLAKAGFEKAK
jgi:phage shock protein E